MTDEEQHELKDAAIAMLVKVASRTSASYEYEIDTLREALRDLLEVCDTSSSIGEYEHREDFEIRISAVRNACAAIDRTDWRAPE